MGKWRVYGGFALCCVFGWNNQTYSAEHWYLGIKAGYTRNNHACEPSALKCDATDIGYGTFGGYKFNQRWAAELSVADIGESSAAYPDVTLDGKLFAADITLKYSRRLNPDSRFFAKAGAAHWWGEIKGWETKLDGSGITPTAGIGIATRVSDQLSARLEYQYFFELGDDEMGYAQGNFISVGFVWHFTPVSSDAHHQTRLTPAPELLESEPIEQRELSILGYGPFD